MSLKGLRFTLEVDGQEPDTFAVVNFRLIQNQSYPFVMSVDVASEERNADYLAGCHPAALCHRRGGGVWYAGEQRLADALSPAY